MALMVFNKDRRVVITGMSIITPIGVVLEEYWSNLMKGKCGFNKVTSFDPSEYRTQIAGEVKDDILKLCGGNGNKKIERLERVALFGLAASISALKNAGLDLGSKALTSFGVVLGSGIGGMLYYENQMINWLNNGSRRVHPNSIARITPNTVSSNVAIYLNCAGPDLTISTACSSGSHAIGISYMLIKNGVCDSIITGGAEAPIAPVLFAAFDNMKVMSSLNSKPEDACKPFDKDRTGFILGEGAAILVIEELEKAKKRGAKILAEISGYGLSNGGHHMVVPAPEGLGEAAAMEMAIQMGDVKPEAVDYIQAHGTGTIANDVNETIAIKKVFGSRSKNVDISSTKGQTGHLLGASGALNCITATLAMMQSILPPISNLKNLDSLCDLNYLSVSKNRKIRYALANSFGFGNNNASVLLKEYPNEN